jgi:hexulose-6-phosphate isomerase
MNHPLNRREFVEASAVVAAGALAAGHLALQPTNVAAQEAAPPTFKKALKLSMVGAGNSILEKFKIVKEAGYDGIDMDGPPAKHDEVLKARDETGLVIHGVVDHPHWSMPLSAADAKVREQGLAGLMQALKDAKAYGGTTVLLVPAVVNKDTSYADAYTRSQEEIRKALPLAAELGIKIAIENVWNMFLMSPLELVRYIDEFQSPWIGSYFDIGNVVNYGWPEQWIRILGKRIIKLDIKEYSRKRRDTSGPYAGFGAPLGEGDCDWPAVLKALREIGYSGWATAEVAGGDLERLKDIAQRMDRILEIKKAT